MSKPRQGGLGRGLGALIPPDAAAGQGPLRDLPVGDIDPNTFQPRQTFDEEALVALTSSVRELGVLQPILVRERPNGRFELIAGERRWRAAQRAGLDLIPAIIREVDDETSLAHAIVENVQRAELNAIEEAAAFQQLIEDFELTQDEVATRVGRSRSAVANTIRLLQLPTELQKSIVDGSLSAGHGRVLVTIEGAEQSALADRVIGEGLSVRSLERLARGEDIPVDAAESDAPLAPSNDDSAGSAPASDAGVGSTKPPALLELEELLGDRFETKVSISMGSARGKISIDFADIDDLERIYALMGSETP